MKSDHSLIENTYNKNGFFDNKVDEFAIKDTSHSDNNSNICSPELMIKKLKDKVKEYYYPLVNDNKK